MTCLNCNNTLLIAFVVSMGIILFLVVFALLSVIETSVLNADRKQKSIDKDITREHVIGVDDGLLPLLSQQNDRHRDTPSSSGTRRSGDGRRSHGEGSKQLHEEGGGR